MPAQLRNLRWRAVGLGLVIGSGLTQAQTFTYQTSDLLLNFRKAGAPADVEVDLGSITQFSSLAPGATLSLSSRYSVSLQLIPTFGSLDSLSFSVIGTQRGAGANAANTSWLTLKRSDADTENLAPQLYTASKTAAIQSAISGIAGDGTSTGALVYAAKASAPSTATALVIPTSGINAANSYSVKYSAVGGLASLVTSPGVENTTPATFSTSAGAVVRSDLFEYAPGVAGVPAGSQPQAQNLGYFTFSQDGTLSFTRATSVPEPGPVAMLGGAAGLWLLGRWARRSRQ